MDEKDILSWLRGEYDSFNLLKMAQLLSAATSARYYLEKMPTARPLASLRNVHKFANQQRGVQGLTLEFGVASGRTINFIAEDSPNEIIYGFDSFQGLPETWRVGFEKNSFSQEAIPELRENVELITGNFRDTLRPFLEAHTGPVSYLHVDCDLYSSTDIIFRALGQYNRIIPGTIIVFDEYFNYAGWEMHEYKAFQEYIRRSDVRYEYLGFRPVHQQVVIRIIS